MRTADRDRLITFQRPTITEDELGQEVAVEPVVIEQAYAQVRFGTAQEKREAAQEGGMQTATFEVLPTSALLGATLTDQILFGGSAWDITEVAPLNRENLRFTAKRRV